MLSPDAPYWQPVRALLGEEGLRAGRSALLKEWGVMWDIVGDV